MSVQAQRRIEDYNIFDLDAPHAKWKQLREEKPVFQDPESGYWIITRHADIKAVFDDWKTFSSENAQAPMRPMCDAGKQIMKDGGFTVYSGLSARVPPDHTRIRKLAQSAFGPRRFKAIQPQIEAIIDRHLIKIAAAGECDFFRDVAYDVPALVLFALMGIPDADVPKVKDWAASRALLTWGNLSDEDQLPLAHKMVAYWSYCRGLVAARKKNPGDDFPTDMVRTQAEGGDITDEEIAGLMYSVLFAGHETTTTLMSNAVITLMSNRDAWNAICADPGLILAATEELLRFEPSIVSWRRKAKTDAKIGGIAIPKGADILLVMGSGNRDAAAFENAESFDIERQNARNHLSFGYGIHFCIGFQLAKMELGIMLRELTARFPNMTLKPDQQIDYLHNISFRVPNQVMVDLGLEKTQ
jgi:cytochrome P450